MPRFVRDMNPTVRGFILIALVSVVIVALSLESTLVALGMIMRVAFLLAIAFFLFLMWRERRTDIGMWPGRAQFAFYGAVAVIVADIATLTFVSPQGLDVLAFFAVLALAALALWRTWRDQRAYA